MRLYDLPQATPESVYASARTAVREKYRSVPGVLAVLEFGTIPYLGISDMDFLIITEPNAHVRLPHFSEYTEDQRYAMGHRHYAVSASVYPFLDYVDPWFVKVDPLLDPSKRFDFKKGSFSEAGYKALSLNFIHQKMIFGSLPFLAQTLRDNALCVRHFFEEIKLFRYFLREFKKVHAPHIEEDPSLERYDEVARTWFEMSEEKRRAAMEDVLARDKDSILRALRMLHRAVEQGYATRDVGSMYAPQTAAARRWLRLYPQSLVIDTGPHVFIYQKGRSDLSIIQYGATTAYLLPWSLGCFATQHLFVHGPLSAHYRAFVATDLSEVPAWENADLLYLAHLDNRNLWETRHTENCKFYQMTHGYRPLGGGSSLGSALSLLRSIFASRREKLLWQTPL